MKPAGGNGKLNTPGSTISQPYQTNQRGNSRVCRVSQASWPASQLSPTMASTLTTLRMSVLISMIVDA